VLAQAEGNSAFEAAAVALQAENRCERQVSARHLRGSCRIRGWPQPWAGDLNRHGPDVSQMQKIAAMAIDDVAVDSDDEIG
jgi:hypothetical protein